MSVTLRTWFREPLLHFLVAGAAIFLLYRLVGGGEEGPREIVVSEAQIESLAEGFARTWMRPPTAAEIRGLVDDYIREEVYYREAMTLGLDRDDTVIRRRLRQKMEFVSDDVASVQRADGRGAAGVSRQESRGVCRSAGAQLRAAVVQQRPAGRGCACGCAPRARAADCRKNRSCRDRGRPVVASAGHDGGDSARDRQRLWRSVRR